MIAIRTSWVARVLVTLCMTAMWSLDTASSVYAGRAAESGEPSKSLSKIERGKAMSKAGAGKKVTPHQTDALDRCEAEAQVSHQALHEQDRGRAGRVLSRLR